MQAWVSFGLAVTLCTIGPAYLPGTDLDHGFMIMGYAFCLTSAFALAKFIRDNEMRKMDTPLWRVVVWAGFAGHVVHRLGRDTHGREPDLQGLPRSVVA